MQNALVGDSKADAQWLPMEAVADSANTVMPASTANTAAPSLAAVLQTATTGANTAPPDPIDVGRVKRQAIEVAGATGPQQPAQAKP